MNMTTYQWGIVGLGNIAHRFASTMNDHGLQPYAVASRNQARSDEFKEKFNAVKSYGDYTSLFQDEDVDVVYIASINSQHFALIKEALENGKHVLCEKAIWHDSRELALLKQLADDRQLILAEAMTIFHMPLMHELKRLIASGKLGEIKQVQADFGSLKEDDPTNRFFSKEKGGGSMLDIGTYALSFLSFFSDGALVELDSFMIPYAPTGVDERWAISMRTTDDIMLTSNLSFRAKLPKRALIAGDLAYVEIMEYPRADEATIVYPDGSEEVVRAGRTEDALWYELTNMEEAIAGNREAILYEKTAQTVDWMSTLLKREHLI